jgi:hypothetical protein
VSDVPVLPYSDLELLGEGPTRRLYAFSTDVALEDVLRPEFLGKHCLTVQEGEQVQFLAGPPGERVYGILVVTAVEQPAQGRPALVHTTILARTSGPLARPRTK